jgi:transformation/transcription domain-associated protein
VNDSGLADARREERILQLMRMLNAPLAKFKETSKRFINITVPRVVAVFPQMRLVEDVPSSMSLLDIYKNYCASKDKDSNASIFSYYDRLVQIQKRGHQAGHLILKDIFEDIQTKIIPKTILKNWALKTFESSTDFWTFRKMFTSQLAVWSAMEYAFYLTRLNPDMLYIHKDTGLANVAYYKFEFDDAGETNAARSVPIRLTPNICELIGNMGISGPFTATMMVMARCFLQPSFQVNIFI